MISLEELTGLIGRFGPIMKLHPEEKYFMDDPSLFLDSGQCSLNWGLIKNPKTGVDKAAHDNFLPIGDDLEPLAGGTIAADGIPTPLNDDLSPVDGQPGRLNAAHSRFRSRRVSSAGTLMDAVAAAMKDREALQARLDAGEPDSAPDAPANARNTRFFHWLAVDAAAIPGNQDRARSQVCVKKSRMGDEAVEIQFWFYYPFNGPGKFHIHIDGIIDRKVQTGTLGRHYGDWEHVTVVLHRSSGDWRLHALYLSRHNLSVWETDLSRFQFAAGRPVIYVARDSHAHYAAANPLNAYRRVARYDPAKMVPDVDFYDITGDGGIDFETGANRNHVLVASDYAEHDVRPPDWFGFDGHWGQHERLHYVYRDTVFGKKIREDFWQVAMAPKGPGQHGPDGPPPVKDPDWRQQKPWSDGNGWDRPLRYGSIRFAVAKKALHVLGRGQGGVETYRLDKPRNAWIPVKIGVPSVSDDDRDTQPQYTTTAQTDVVNDEVYYLYRTEGGIVSTKLTDAANLRPGDAFFTGGDTGWVPLTIASPPWSDRDGWDQPQYYSTIRTAALKGELMVLGRGPDGLETYRITPDTKGESQKLCSGDPGWSDRHGWNRPEYYSTIRTAVAEDTPYVLARGARGVETYRFDRNEKTWNPVSAGNPAWTDKNGWDQPQHYSTMQTAVVKGSVYLLARGADGMETYRLDARRNGWTPVASGDPAWSDQQGWNRPQYYSTIRADAMRGALYLSARGAAGMVVYRLEPGSKTWRLVRGIDPAWSDENGWDQPQYYSTIRTAVIRNELYLLARGPAGIEVRVCRFPAL